MKKIKEQLRLLKLLLTDIELNHTHAEHAFVAVLHQLAVVAVFGWVDLNASLWAGAALGAGVFMGREYAQVERKILNKLGCDTYIEAESIGYDVCEMAKSFKHWNKDSLFDQWFPKVAVILIAVVMTVLTPYLMAITK